jgi:hypothetical protein
MRDRKRRRLLRKRERKFPDYDNRGVDENGEGSVLEFASEIAADPRVRTEQRQVSFRPTPRHVSENRENRKLVIVVPKEKRIVPEEDEGEADDNKTSAERAEDFRTRAARFGHLQKKTSNAQRRTPNVEFRGSVPHFAFFSGVRTLAAKIHQFLDFSEAGPQFVRAR